MSGYRFAIPGRHERVFRRSPGEVIDGQRGSGKVGAARTGQGLTSPRIRLARWQAGGKPS